MPETKSTHNINVPPELWEKLRKLAADDERSISQTICRICADAIARKAGKK